MSDAKVERIQSLIRDIPDFPKPGIMFKDITPLLADASAFADMVALMAAPYREQRIDYVLGMEARGFLLGVPVAAAKSTPWCMRV
jgi:adenine phosphoribosyltransferase